MHHQPPKTDGWIWDFFLWLSKLQLFPPNIIRYLLIWRETRTCMMFAPYLSKKGGRDLARQRWRGSRHFMCDMFAPFLLIAHRLSSLFAQASHIASAPHTPHQKRPKARRSNRKQEDGTDVAKKMITDQATNYWRTDPDGPLRTDADAMLLYLESVPAAAANNNARISKIELQSKVLGVTLPFPFTDQHHDEWQNDRSTTTARGGADNSL